MKYIAHITLVGFCTLVAFGYGRAWLWNSHGEHAYVSPVELREAVGNSAAERAAANEFVERAIAQAAARKPSKSERAAALHEKQAEYAALERDRCGDDAICLIAWAERKNPFPEGRK